MPQQDLIEIERTQLLDLINIITIMTEILDKKTLSLQEEVRIAYCEKTILGVTEYMKTI
jgi:hypothetical protein